MAQPKLIKSLRKGLEVLQHLNLQSEISVSELSQLTNIPRPTLYRILDTLIEDGFVTKAGRGDIHELTIKVNTLSAGFNDEEWVSDIAAPLISELGNEVVWPVDLATFDGDAMLVRLTTHPTSPISLERGYSRRTRRGFPGFRIPFLRSATGQAYLAACTPHRQKAILEVLAHSDHEECEMARNTRRIKSILKSTREQGYAVGTGQYGPTAILSVPVVPNQEPISCINLAFIVSAVSPAEVVDQYLQPLKSAAANLENALRAAAESGLHLPHLD